MPATLAPRAEPTARRFARIPRADARDAGFGFRAAAREAEGAIRAALVASGNEPMTLRDLAAHDPWRLDGYSDAAVIEAAERMADAGELEASDSGHPHPAYALTVERRIPEIGDALHSRRDARLLRDDERQRERERRAAAAQADATALKRAAAEARDRRLRGQALAALVDRLDDRAYPRRFRDRDPATVVGRLAPVFGGLDLALGAEEEHGRMPLLLCGGKIGWLERSGDKRGEAIHVHFSPKKAGVAMFSRGLRAEHVDTSACGKA